MLSPGVSIFRVLQAAEQDALERVTLLKRSDTILSFTTKRESFRMSA